MEYITQKSILKSFRDTDITEFEIYISFVGDFDVRGYHMTSSKFKIIKPKKLLIRKKHDDYISFFKNLELDKDTDFDKMVLDSNKAPSYPLPIETVSNFLYQVSIFENGEEIEFEGNLMDNLKFFKTMNDAEMNFIAMLNTYLKSNNLDDAVIYYNQLIKKYEEVDPSNLLKLI